MSSSFLHRSWLVLVVLAAAGLTAYAGDLEPPAPPGPTMKPLPELEPRTPIFADQLPLTISSPGSYYLAESITTAGGGITVDASYVTIDLMGFTLSAATGACIKVNTGEQYVTVKNGTVKGCGGHGVWLDWQGTVSDLLAIGNGSIGIEVGRFGVVRNSTAMSNDTDGISVGGESLVHDCLADSNQVNGIVAASYSTIRDNVVVSNFSNGIKVDGYSLVRGNNCNNNGYTNNRAGIFATWNGNRIEENHLGGNYIGIEVDGTSNFVFRNTGSNNGTDFDIVTGNCVGTIVTTESAMNSATNDLVNIGF
jgi:hypothetical protein